MKKQLALITIILIAMSSFSQNWNQSMQRGDNFYKIQEEFNAYWKDKDIKVKGKGYKQFRRWEAFMEPRVYPSGDLSLPSQTWDNYEAYLKTNSKNQSKSQMVSTTWTPLGPMGNLSGLAENGLPRKAGRLNFMTFHPSIAGTFWVGAPAGGLWKTTNNGASWTTNTDNLAVIGCSDLAIDPLNTNNMFLATGDAYNFQGRGSYSRGVLTSTNAGTSWNPTGLSFTANQLVMMRRLIINPVNPLIIIAATNQGIYTTTNGGISWPQVSTANAYDLEFNATSANTVYATGTSFSVSTDAGQTFVQVINGIPAGGGRSAVAVTPANPNCVYVVKTNDVSFTGIYRSLNAGVSFSLMSNTPNILSFDCVTPMPAEGQGIYDLALASSPTNAAEVVVGGIAVWKSLNSGSSFTNIGCAYTVTMSPIPFIHADHHELEYLPNGTLYDVCDGGLSQYTGTLWNDLNGTMNIAQMWKMGLSSLSPNLLISGHQDNGSNIYDNGNYSASLSSDGSDCFIDRTNDLNLFASRPNGAYYYSTNGGLAWTTCTAGAPGPGAWVSPWKQDPQNANTFYAGQTQMKKSTAGIPPVWFAPQGAMAPVTAGQYIREFCIAPSNNQVIYAIHGTSGVFKSIDAGVTWTITNNNLPFWTSQLMDIKVSPTNPNNAWVVFSGYTAGTKVWKTITGGTTWTAVTTAGLPNLPVNCIVYENGNVNDRIYIGMDVGVYYIDNLAASWTLYNTGLPNTSISDLEISPASPVKLRASTFGRGIYQVDIVPSNSPPVSAFNYAGVSCSLTASLLFNDNSTNSPTSWSWSVTPMAGVTINTPVSQNPTISFANYGTYTVSLMSTNGFGPGSLTNQTLNIAPPVITATASSPTTSVGSTVSLTGGGANTYTWQPGNLTGILVSYTPVSTQVYTLTATTLNGCIGTTTISVIVSPILGIIPNANGALTFSVFPNPTHDKLTINIAVDKARDFGLEITDASGKFVLKQIAQFDVNKNEQQINISSLSNGIYFLKIIAKDGDAGSFNVIKLIKE